MGGSIENKNKMASAADKKTVARLDVTSKDREGLPEDFEGEFGDCQGWV